MTDTRQAYERVRREADRLAEFPWTLPEFLPVQAECERLCRLDYAEAAARLNPSYEALFALEVASGHFA